MGIAFHYQDKASIFSRRIAREMVMILEAIANPDNLECHVCGFNHPYGFRSNAPDNSEQLRFVELQTELFNARDLWKSDGPAAAVTRLFETCLTAQRIPHTLNGLEDWNVLTHCLEIFGEDAKGLSPLEAAIWWSQQVTSKKEADDRTSQRPPVGSGVVTINTIHDPKDRVVILADRSRGRHFLKAPGASIMRSKWINHRSDKRSL